MVVPSHPCAARKPDGSPCLAAPMQDATHCFWHNPDSRDEAQDARRRGGQRRRRETLVTSHFDLDGVHSLADLARVLEVAITDTLELPNSIARNRTLAQLIQTGLRLYLPEPPLIQLPDRTPGHTLADTPPHLSLLPACPTADHASDVRPHGAPSDPSLRATPDPTAEGGP